MPWATGPVTLGALVQVNFGGELTVLGTPIPAAEALAAAGIAPQEEQGFGGSSGGGAPRLTGNSCVIVLATDAALDSRQLERVARRAFAGMARTGSDFSGRSGDYAMAFSTAGLAGGSRTGTGSRTEDSQAPPAWRATGRPDDPVPEKDLDVLFKAAIEATEEAILNSLFMAVTTGGFGGHVRHAVPLDYVRARVRIRPAGDS